MGNCGISMKGKSNCVLFCMVLFTICAAAGAMPWQGGGTGGNPYLIANADDMQKIGGDPNYWDAHFQLTANIDLGKFTGMEFNIIGNESKPFTGTFDGNGHTIRNFTYMTTETGAIGLFGIGGYKEIFRGSYQALEIHDLGLEDVDILAPNAEYAGALVGIMSGGPPRVTEIARCFVTGSITAGQTVGGLVGNQSSWSKISDCYTQVSVTTNTGPAGGIAGNKVSGYKNTCQLNRCYAAGPVEGNGFVGTIVGQAGVYCPGPGPHNCSAYFDYCFYDKQTCGPYTCVGNVGVNNCSGKTTAEMLVKETFTADGWDFDNIWVMWRNSRPHLAWEGDANYDGGDGTADLPYEIRTAGQLNSIGLRPDDWNSHFILMADIDLGKIRFPAPAQFNVIGHYVGLEDPCNVAFNGGFDGNGHTVSNLIHDFNQTYGAGMFAYLGGDAYVRDLNLENARIYGPNARYVGALAGANYGSVSSCFASGSVTGAWFVGGLVGSNGAGGTISASCAAVDAAADQYAGGLAGGNLFTIVTDCCALGEVTANTYAGGLVGTNWGGISNCYAAGRVQAYSNLGALVGENSSYGFISNSLWDMQAVGLTVMCGENSTNACDDSYARTEGDMMLMRTFTDVGWDFAGERRNGIDDIWKMTCESKSYPKLSWWQPALTDFACPDGVDGIDLWFWTESWLDHCSTGNTRCERADLNGDGVVNFDDFAAVGDKWLRGF